MNSESSSPDLNEIFEGLEVCRSLVKKVEESVVAVRLQTTGFEIVADCDLQGQRISDVLNTSMSDYLECANASLSRAGRIVETIPHIKVRKPEIVIAGIVGTTHEAASKRVGSRRSLDLFQAVVAADRWIVRGRLHMTSQKSVKEFLHANRDFFPIADATVLDSESPDKPESVSVAIVNRARVSFMEITELADSQAGPHSFGAQEGEFDLESEIPTHRV